MITTITMPNQINTVLVTYSLLYCIVFVINYPEDIDHNTHLISNPLVRVHFLLLAKSFAVVAPSPVLLAIVKLVLPSPCSPNATRDDPFLIKIEVFILLAA